VMCCLWIAAYINVGSSVRRSSICCGSKCHRCCFLSSCIWLHCRGATKCHWVSARLRLVLLLNSELACGQRCMQCQCSVLCACVCCAVAGSCMHSQPTVVAALLQYNTSALIHACFAVRSLGCVLLPAVLHRASALSAGSQVA
jgi:hypothetical protein